MKIVNAGLNHRTAEVELREKLAFKPDQQIEALRLLKDRYPGAEFVLLSTCNRVEIYTVSESAGGFDLDAIIDFLSEFHNIPRDDFSSYIYANRNEQAVRHLLKVACGIDSMVVGEEQILSQVKDSYRIACNAKSTGKILNRLFHCAFATSKRIHSSTSISDGRVSVAGVAAGLAKQLFADIPSAKAVIIGAGEMGQLLIKHLSCLGCSDITVVNRSYQHGSMVARRFGIKARPWAQLPELLARADIAIASASTQNYLFSKNYMQEILAERDKGTLLIIDIAVPRNFEPQVSDIKNVKIYSIDQLSDSAKRNRKLRQEDIAACMQIISESTGAFMDWFSSRDVGPLIGVMKEQFSQISRNELERYFAGSRQNASSRGALEEMVDRIASKFLHCIIRNVDTIAKEKGASEAASLVENIVQQAGNILSQPVDREDVK